MSAVTIWCIRILLQMITCSCTGTLHFRMILWSCEQSCNNFPYGRICIIGFRIGALMGVLYSGIIWWVKFAKFNSLPNFQTFNIHFPAIYGTGQVPEEEFNLRTSIRTVVRTRHLFPGRMSIWQVGMSVWHVLEESATLACHCIWVLCIGHLPFTANVFNFSGQL